MTRRLHIPIPFAAVLLLLAAGRAFSCKYSVRDLAFMDIHQSGWELLFVEAADGEQTFGKNWDKIVARLEASNLVGQRVSANALAEEDACVEFRDATEPLVLLRGHGRCRIVWSTSQARELEGQLEELIRVTPSRDEIFRSAAQSLCTFVIVEGADADPSVAESVHVAARQVADRMWTFDKAPPQGPAVVTIASSDREREFWTLYSLGIDPGDPQTRVAIVFGRGRCLGQPVGEAEISIDQLITLASICGRDCECELDPRQLYGRSMIGRWDSAYETLAAESLDFDPQSAMVVVEASRILSRSIHSHQQRNGDGTDLAAHGFGGLTIHELPRLGNDSTDSTDSTETAGSETHGEAIREPASPPPVRPLTSQSATPPPGTSTRLTLAMPIMLLGAIGLIAAITAGMIWMTNASE